MTHKERWLSSIKHQQVDRLVFWPKIFNNAYVANQKAPFNQMTIPELHEWIGSDIQVSLPGYIKTVHKNSTHEVKDEGGVKRVIYSTKYGSIEGQLKYDIASQSWHPIKMAIQNVEDVKIMMEWFLDCEVELDKRKLQEASLFAQRMGERVLIADSIGESPLMEYIEWLAGVENGNYLMYDYSEEVEGLFDAMHQLLKKKAKISAEYSPADVLYFTENTSTTLISVSQFRKYCFRHIEDYARIVKGSKRILCLHMCGYLKDLLPDMNKLEVDAFEAFTSPSLGNTTLKDGRTICPDKCFIGGTNAVLWTKKTDEIIEQLEMDLNELPHHKGIIVSSAGVMPPLCPPETIKEVCEWVKSYKVKC